MTVRAKSLMAFNIGKLLRYTWHELMYGGHILSIGASATVLAVLMLMERESSVFLLTTPYLIAQLVYALNRRKDIKSDRASNPERTHHMLKNKPFFMYSIYIYSAFLILALVTSNSIETVLLVALILALGIIYPKHLTKKIIGFKNYYVSFLWTLSFVSLPFVYYETPINSLYIFLFAFVLSRAMLNTTFFDLKDVKVDKENNLKTFPVVIGYNNTLLLLTFYNILSGLILLFAVYFDVMDIKTSVLLLAIHYSFYYLFLAYKNRDDEKIRKLSYVMVDGEYIFWPLLLALAGVV